MQKLLSCGQMRTHLTSLFLVLCCHSVIAQSSAPVEHIADKKAVPHAFINATVHVDARTMLTNAVLLIKEGKVLDIGQRVKVPANAVVHDLKGSHIWPALVEPYSNRGLPNSNKLEREKEPANARHWNGALRADTRASEQVVEDKLRDEELRKAGYGTVVANRMDGVARGTSAAFLLNNAPLQKAMIAADGAAHFSFDRGSSPDGYPRSRMGAVALLRQGFLDATWYAQQKQPLEQDPVLIALAAQMKKGVVFEAEDRNELLRCAKLMDEFGLTGCIKGAGDEYARVAAIRLLGRPLIIPTHLSDAYDVEDPYDALEVPLHNLQHWALAPQNAAILDSAGVMFAFTSYGRKDLTDLWKDLRRMVACGLDSARAIDALTMEPARLCGIEHQVGALRTGMLANFIVSTKHLLNEKNEILETWVGGEQFIQKEHELPLLAGTYEVILPNEIWLLMVKEEDGKPSANVVRIGDADTTKIKADIARDGIRISLSFAQRDTSKGSIRLSGVVHADGGLWDGQGQRLNGEWFPWSAIRKAEKKRTKETAMDSTKFTASGFTWITYPLNAFGWRTPPERRTVIFRNATVWTNTESAILRGVDVCIHEGKILSIGASLNPAIIFPGRIKPTVVEIDATGKHLTTGIIDEHSHIAISRGVNEGSSAISSEVRIGDVLNPDDINIYRDLAGGVTTAQLLHGSANPIGGQSALIKMRWGRTADSLLIDHAPAHIKFALGENVKQSNWNSRTKRFPQTRMGVEQFFYEQFHRAEEYDNEWRSYNELKPKQRDASVMPRRDLRLEALVEIMNGDRNITCHSYVQSEIDMLMHVADSMGFKVNTFTHILEGYKVAGRMKAHGVNASTFSDWWAYKFEVYDAIPYNAALLHDAGVNTGINSDDAEMGRRLNQEAAKTVKYGGVSEVEAWKMVTLNPAKMLKLDHRLGSVEVGKDADLVLWSANPLSILARAERTYVDGICYFDLEQDAALRKAAAVERDRLIREMISAKKGGARTKKPEREEQHLWHCDDLGDGRNTVNEDAH